jgi:DNA-binding NarL/FixJ family response regulator
MGRGWGGDGVGVRVLIVDDHQAFSGAMALLLDDQPDVTVVGTAAGTEDALAVMRATRPDVMVVDVEIGDDDGIDLTRRVRTTSPDTKVIILTCHDDVDTATQAVRAGARGFVRKEAPAEELVGAIRAAVHGDTVIPPGLLTGVLEQLQANGATAPPASRLDLLTDRERDVLRLMVDGADRASIASRLYLSPNTVRTHVQRLMTKLGVHSSLEAVALAVRAGWSRAHD